MEEGKQNHCRDSIVAEKQVESRRRETTSQHRKKLSRRKGELREGMRWWCIVKGRLVAMMSKRERNGEGVRERARERERYAKE